MSNKNIYTKGFLFLLAASLFTACQDDDTVETVNKNKPTVSLGAGEATQAIVENGVATFTLTVDKPTTKEMDFKLEFLPDGSTGGAAFRDFVVDGLDVQETNVNGDGGYGQGVIGYIIHFPAFAQTATFSISVPDDFKPGTSKTLKIGLRSALNGQGLVAADSSVITLNVSDFVSEDVGIRLSWDGTTADTFGTLHEGTYTTTTGTEGSYTDFDFDFYVFDSSLSVDVTDAAAATGNSPENAVLETSSLADGDYYIVVDLYDSPENAATEFNLPVKLEVTKFGTWYAQINPPYTSSSLSSYPSGLTDGIYIAAILTKTGSTYTLTDYNTDQVLAQGRRAQLLSKIQGLRGLKKSKK